MPKLTRFLIALLTAAGALAAFSASTLATTISSTVLEINGSTTQGDGQNQSLSTTFPAKLTDVPGYDFSVNFSSLTAVTFIQVTLTMQDGNSSPDDGEGFDFNHLFLGLDGINTGLVLNGFRGNGLQDTLTFSGAIDPTIGAAIFASLQDGFLVGSIITDNPSDSIISPNDIFVGNDALNATTTLVISDAVPEPTTIGLVATGLILAFAPKLRRLRRKS